VNLGVERFCRECSLHRSQTLRVLPNTKDRTTEILVSCWTVPALLPLNRFSCCTRPQKSTETDSGLLHSSPPLCSRQTWPLTAPMGACASSQASHTKDEHVNGSAQFKGREPVAADKVPTVDRVPSHSGVSTPSTGVRRCYLLHP